MSTKESTAMSAQARINGSELALRSPKKAPKNSDWPCSKFDRPQIVNLEKELCNEHYYSQCRCRPGQRASMELERRLRGCARARLPR